MCVFHVYKFWSIMSLQETYSFVKGSVLILWCYLVKFQELCFFVKSPVE